jgi:hypothetical protein
MGAILQHSTVERDGLHNAFTDLIYWQGQYFVSYRKGTAHASLDGEACVSVSCDRQRWRPAGRVKIPGDNRDPKLVAVSPERLAMVFPTWEGGVAQRRLQQYVSFSNDGYNWETPIKILEAGHWLWRVTPFGGRFYGACYDFPVGPGKAREYRLTLLASDDLITWEQVSQIGSVAMAMGESAMHFQADGELWIVSRQNQAPSTSYFSVSQPPYTQWETSNLDTMIHAPVILAHNDKLFVAGRRSTRVENDQTWPFMGSVQSTHSLGIWQLERGKVTPVMRIPAMGDCSYPGLIKDPEGRVCLSYYSQHAYFMGVVPHRYRQQGLTPAEGDILPQADVYFCELELP